MTISYREFPVHQVTVMTCSGIVSFDDAMELLTAELDTETPPPHLVLADLSRIQQVDISFREMLTLISEMSSHFKAAKAATPHIAIFAPSKTTRGMGKLFQMLAGPGAHFKVTMHDTFLAAAGALGQPDVPDLPYTPT